MKTFLRLQNPTQAHPDDGLLQRMLTARSTGIAAYLMRPVFEADFDDRYTGAGTRTLTPKWTPIKSVSLLEINGQAVRAATPGGNDTGYLFDAFAVYLRGSTFPREPMCIRLKHTAGWDDDERAPELADIAIRLVAERYREIERLGLVSKGLAGETTTFSPKDMPEWARRELQPYRRVALG